MLICLAIGAFGLALVIIGEFGYTYTAPIERYFRRKRITRSLKRMRASGSRYIAGSDLHQRRMREH